MEGVLECEIDEAGSNHDKNNRPKIHTLKNSFYNHRGLIAAFCACVCAALQNVLAKFLQDDIPVTEVLFARYMIQGTLSFICALPVKVSFRPSSSRELTLLIIRGIFGTIGVGCQYFAVYKMAAGMMTAITHSSPIFVGILAWIIFREKFYLCDVILMATDIIGVVMIAQPPFLFPNETFDEEKQAELLGVALSVIAMLISAFTHITVRALGRMGTNSLKIVLYYSLFGFVLPPLLGLVIQDWLIPPCGWVRFVVVGVGLLNFGAQSLISYALSAREQTYYIAIVYSLQIPLTVILELVLLAYIPSWASSVGTVIILVCGFGVVFRERAVQKRKVENRVPKPRIDIEL
ncbi:putative solute carrier family 35 member G1 [Apostichopus japonicus]|uniref:Putative solute carrier family 35 member G1 n=1 Tax=Stichopus japonicus TaxID=307972 RepID=A0A2G8KRL5_STIJA|nr:putative solute carrier family 35 member G1 [Apostichopus japonicus]